MKEIEDRSIVNFINYMMISDLDQNHLTQKLLHSVPYMMYEYFMLERIIPGKPLYNKFKDEDVENAKLGECENEYDQMIAGSKDMFYIEI